jgi:CAAX prenyl protease-like protein
MISTDARPWLPYVAPMAAFLLLTNAEGWLPTSDGRADPRWYPIAYAAKVGLVSAVAWACRSTWRDLAPRPGPAVLGLAATLGVAVAAVWVGLDGHYPPIPWLGTRQGFDPSALPAGAKAAFLAVRLFGLVLLVPLIEELFWRSFLMRWVIDPDFLRVPIGRVTPAAALVTSALFALGHPEWLPGLVTGLAWAWLLRRTRSVSACLVSHMAANLALGVYVFAQGAWRFL